MARQPCCLILRPVPEAHDDVLFFHKNHIPAHAVPLQTVVTTPLSLPLYKLAEHDAVVFTSPRAFLSLTAEQKILLQHKPIYGVGENTARQLRQQGWKIKEIQHTAWALIQKLKQLPFERLLYLRGAVVTYDLTQHLSNHCVNSAITYKLCPQKGAYKGLTDVFWQDNAARPILVLFHALSTALCFMKLGLPTAYYKCSHALCLSSRIHKELINKGFNITSCTKDPSRVSLLKEALTLYKKNV